MINHYSEQMNIQPKENHTTYFNPMKGRMWKEESGGRTDWTAYYRGKKNWFSTKTQKITLRVILSAMEKYLGERNGLKIAEFGGGNSCFAKDICVAKKDVSYHVFDNNELAIELFNKMDLKVREHLGVQRDLLDSSESDITEYEKYDFVYSIGLIEHFQGEDVKRMIRKHYEYCKPGGIVLVTFPTSTCQYSLVRKCMEFIGVWQFYDERPIRYEEVKDVFERSGTVEEWFINRRLPLTQTVVITRK